MEAEDDDLGMAVAGDDDGAGLDLADFDVAGSGFEDGSGFEFKVARAEAGGGGMRSIPAGEGNLLDGFPHGARCAVRGGIDRDGIGGGALGRDEAGEDDEA